MIEPRCVSKWRLFGALGALSLASCGSTHQPYSLDMPPLLLAPATSAGIIDSRSRFREIYCAVAADHGASHPYHRPCEQALHRLAGEAPASGKAVHLGPARLKMRIVVVPGIFGECFEDMARPFQDAVEPMARLGWTVTAISVSGRSSSAANARAIRAYLEVNRPSADEKLVLIGYSKGASDLIELLGTDTSDIIPAGSAVLSLAGVVAGTPLADGNEDLYRAFAWVPIKACPPGDGGGVASLTRRHRLNYLASHPLPGHLRYYSLAAFTGRSNTSSFMKSSHSALSKIDPRNDGNVIFHDAILPGSSLVGYVNADHWAPILPFSLLAPVKSKFFATRNEFPRVVLLESIARFLEEQYLAGNPAREAAD